MMMNFNVRGSSRMMSKLIFLLAFFGHYELTQSFLVCKVNREIATFEV